MATGLVRFRLHLLAALILGAGAGGGDGVSDPCARPGACPSVLGSVEVQVTVEGSGLGGVTVALSGPSSRSGNTDLNGTVTFADLPEGTYTASINAFPSDLTFATTSRTVTVSGSGQQAVSFSGEYIRTASIAGTVHVNSQGIPGVTVTLENPDSLHTATTGADGDYGFMDLRSGTSVVSVSGFDTPLQFRRHLPHCDPRGRRGEGGGFRSHSLAGAGGRRESAGLPD